MQLFPYAQLSSDEQRLVDAAVAVSAKSYSPYSNFPVGAAVITKEGEIFTGCNVENAAWATVCAERVAITKAVSEGYLEFVAMALFCATKPGGWPCGVCRQYLREFGSHVTVLSIADEHKSVRKMTLNELLPESFGPHSL